MKTEPFEINIPQEVLDDLQERLQCTRWPDEVKRCRLGLRHEPGLYEGANKLLAAPV